MWPLVSGVFFFLPVFYHLKYPSLYQIIKIDNKCIRKIIKLLWTSDLYQLFKALHLKPRNEVLPFPVVKVTDTFLRHPCHVFMNAPFKTDSVWIFRHGSEHGMPKNGLQRCSLKAAHSVSRALLARGSRGMGRRWEAREGKKGMKRKWIQGKQNLLPGSCCILRWFLNQVIRGSGTPVARQSNVVELLMATAWSLRLRRRRGASWSSEQREGLLLHISCIPLL